MAPPFLPGVELCRLFYAEAVRPLLGDLPHAAARIGGGSDVLGFDTERSTDHDWGPRLELFLRDGDGDGLSEMLSRRLPTRFRGWSTHFPDKGERVRWRADTDGPVDHYITITDAGSWLTGRLGFDPRDGVTLLDWLCTPWQRLAEVTGGGLFHDDIGELTAVRERLAWYPDDVWRYVLACQWHRIGREESFMARAAEAGDDFGSRMAAARVAREVGRLVLLLGRVWPPYQKWLGLALRGRPDLALRGRPGFALRERADLARVKAVMRTDSVADRLDEALRAADVAGREEALCAALEAAGSRQNEVGLAPSVPAGRRWYHDRPYRVIGADRFAAALTAAIEDPRVAALSPVGVVDQAFDSEDALSRPDLRRATMITAHRL
jgi:Domain of unknown function (DUF4037)